MKTSALIRLKLSSEKLLETVFKALEPEVKKPSTMRSSATLKKEGEFLVLKVEAKDTVALRATLNAYLRWINSIMSSIETLKKQ
ncbi:MAG TPA: KEOPS complex subunit Pcc1 [Candidatus Acidoferrum sp.]|jgi:tRNA threonylcarbamoyladenosine modification (KEOPS) complex  Pcc1 subunit|nr:KEOPS complex subunit Pcc1 [Candidatus Acidoferrum sp.]